MYYRTRRSTISSVSTQLYPNFQADILIFYFGHLLLVVLMFVATISSLCVSVNVASAITVILPCPYKICLAIIASEFLCHPLMWYQLMLSPVGIRDSPLVVVIRLLRAKLAGNISSEKYLLLFVVVVIVVVVVVVMTHGVIYYCRLRNKIGLLAILM